MEREGLTSGDVGIVLPWRTLLLAFGIALAGLAALHWGCLALVTKAQLDPMELSDFYPMSVFKLRLPKLYQLGFGVVYAGAVGWLWPRLAGPRRGLYLYVLGGLSLAVLSNLLHGFRFGLDFPTATSGDGGIEYYDDAIVIPGPVWLLQHFNAVQFELLEHSRTHPPGPVLLYWLLHVTLRHPALISVGVCAIGLGLSLPYLRRLLALYFDEAPPGALTLFALLPAMLIYGLAVVDAPIAGLFTATLVSFVEGKRRAWLYSGIWLFLSLFFTFGALFLLPVLAGFELWRRRSLEQSLLTFAVAASGLIALRLGFGFDWLQSFLRASAMENQQGFLLLVSPIQYVWYRIGSVAEIAIFFTPFCWVLWARGLRELRERHADAFAVSLLGPLSLGALLLSGALKIGEAARVCLFILPYLFLPVVAAYRRLDQQGRNACAYAVAGWGAVMQLIGFYQW